MRVLIVNKFAHVTGGADAHCLALAELLRSHGHEVAFLSTASEANLETRGVFVRTRVSNRSRGALSPTQQLDVALRAFWNPEAAHGATRALAEFAPDVVHAHKLYPQLSVAPLAAAARAGVPVVQTVHDHEFVAANAIDDECCLVDRLEERASYRALNTASQVIRRFVHPRLVREWIAVSRYIAGKLPSSVANVHVLPNFVEVPDEVSPFAGRNGVVFVGRLEREKGVDDVLDLARSHPDLRVVVAGDGGMRATVEQAARALPNLDYRGLVARADIPALLAEARVCLLPSRRREGGPMAALEAMAAGTPVVTFAGGGLGEYVADAGGVVVDAPADLDEWCARLAVDEDAWTTRSAAAVAGMRAVHSQDGYYDRLVEVYDRARSVAEGRPRRRPRGSARAGALVLAYHRVADVASDPFDLAVTPANFDEQLEVLRADYTVLPIRELVARACRGEIAGDEVGVTFDDGYADNLLQAKPLLQKHDVPATVFVAAGAVGSAERFWWDSLAQSIEDRAELFRVWQELRHMNEDARTRALAPYRASGAASDGRALTRDEVRELADGGLVTVGAHTVTHPVLSTLDRAGQSAEISGSRAQLEAIVGAPVTEFSFPFGRRTLVHTVAFGATRRPRVSPDYNRTSVELVRAAGFECAWSTNPGRFRSHAARFEGPRVLVRDWDGDTFAKRLAGVR